jgi:osmotically-inducible protein OsmY
MKTDSQLQHDVMDELKWDPIVDSADIGVTADHGAVTLSGVVHSYAEKLAAENAARRVKGVKAIAENLTVRFAGDRKSSDTEIARRIADVFEWNTLIPHDALQAKVEKGYVTLSGKVPWRYQSTAAHDAVVRIEGVVGIRNDITITSNASASNVRQRIEEAIKRQADLDARNIQVTAEGNKVKLSGKVHSWYERRIAEQAAWGAPGVSQVVDEIVISA